MGSDQSPSSRRPLTWWDRLTPLAGDCELALELLHCTPGEYYRRTSPAERMLIRIHLAYRNEQRQKRDELQELRQRAKAPHERPW